MKEFRVIYKNKPSELVASPGRKELIKDLYGGNESQFKNEVDKLVWDELSMQCVWDVQEDKVTSQLFTADVNPYGWRNA